MALTAAELRVIVEAVGTKQARDELNRTGQAVDQTGQRSQRSAAVTQAAGRAIVGSTAAIGAGFAVAVQEGATFQQELANINTVARLTEPQTAALGDAIQQMARDTGISTADLNAAMYDMVSAGTITSDQLANDLGGSMETIRNAADLAIGGMGNIAGTTDVLTSTLNAYGLEATEAARVTDAMAVAIERGKVTADEIGSSIANVAPIAANAGIELEEISAAYATLTANGVPAAEATTQMRAAIVALMSPNERLKDIMADTGINFAEVAKEKGLHVALQQLRDVTDESAEAMQRVSGAKGLEAFSDALEDNQKALGLTNSEMDTLMNVAGEDGVAAAMAEMNKMVTAGEAGLTDALGRIEGFNFLLQTTGDNANTFGENLTAAMDATGTASEQAAIAMEGPVEQAKRLAANVMTWMQDVGGPAAQSLGPFLLAVNQLGPAMMLPVRGATALGGAVGWMAGKLLTGGIPAMKSFGLSLAKGVVFMAGFTGAIIKDSLTALGNFIIRLGAAGLAALRFGTRLAVSAVASIGKFVFALAVQGVAALVGFASTITTTAIPAVVALVAPFLPVIAIIAAVVAVVGGLFLAWQTNFLGIRDIAASVWNAITSYISTAITNITTWIGAFMDFISGIWDGVVDTARAVWQGVADVISGIVNTITGIIGGIVDVVAGVWDAVSGFFGFVTGGAADAKANIAGVGEKATTATRGVRPPQYAAGTMDTGRGGLAILHPHEMVIPRDMADSIRRSIRGGSTPRTGGGEGGIRDINVTITQPVRVRQPAEVVRPLRQLAGLGVFNA